jgi:hypothetical protein
LGSRRFNAGCRQCATPLRGAILRIVPPQSRARANYFPLAMCAARPLAGRSKTLPPGSFKTGRQSLREGEACADCSAMVLGSRAHQHAHGRRAGGKADERVWVCCSTAIRTADGAAGGKRWCVLGDGVDCESLDAARAITRAWLNIALLE